MSSPYDRDTKGRTIPQIVRKSNPMKRDSYLFLSCTSWDCERINTELEATLPLDAMLIHYELFAYDSKTFCNMLFGLTAKTKWKDVSTSLRASTWFGEHGVRFHFKPTLFAGTPPAYVKIFNHATL